MEAQDFVWSKSRHVQEFQYAGWDFLAKLFQAWMRAFPVQFRDDVGDCIADARYFRQPVLFDQTIERNGEGREAVGGSRIGLGG